MTNKNYYNIEGKIKIEFILCTRRRRCKMCPLRGDKCRRKRREVRLLEDVVYTLPGGRQILIKKGFIFDGASIPRFFWRIIGHPLDHEFIRAVLLHDGLYAAELLAQALSDMAFLEFMKYYDDIGWFKRNAMHKGVRIGGGSVWTRHTKESVQEARKYVSFITLNKRSSKMKRLLLIAGIAVCLAGSAGCATEYYPPRKGEKQGAVKREGCLPWSNGVGKNMPFSNSKFGFNVGT